MIYADCDRAGDIVIPEKGVIPFEDIAESGRASAETILTSLYLPAEVTIENIKQFIAALAERLDFPEN